jgi:hypothetical protein
MLKADAAGVYIGRECGGDMMLWLVREPRRRFRRNYCKWWRTKFAPCHVPGTPAVISVDGYQFNRSQLVPAGHYCVSIAVLRSVPKVTGGGRQESLLLRWLMGSPDRPNRAKSRDRADRSGRRYGSTDRGQERIGGPGAAVWPCMMVQCQARAGCT